MPRLKDISLFKTTFFFLLVFGFGNSYSQTFFNVYTNFNLGGMAMEKSPDGNLFVGGSKGDSAMVMKITPMGLPIWTIAFKPTTSTHKFYVTSFQITPDNFLIGVGVSTEPATILPGEAFYFKMDLAGNVIYCKVISGVAHRFTIRRMLVLSTTSYIIIGAHEPVSGAYADPMIIKIDGTNGNVVLQSPRYDYDDIYIDDISESLLSTDKKAVYSTGRMYISGATPDQMRIFITKFDTMGNDLWTKYFVYPTTSAARMYGHCMTKDNDTLVINYCGDNNGTSANFELGLLKSDTAGNMLWSKNYEITGSTFEKCFRIFKMSYGYAMVGFETGASQNLLVLTVDHNGNVLWCKSYGSSTQDEFNVPLFGALPATTVGDTIYFTGIRVLTATTTDMVIGKCDQNGDIDCATVNNLNVVTTNNPVFTDTRIITATPEPVAFTPVTYFEYPVIPDPCPPLSVSLGNDQTICATINLQSQVNTSCVNQTELLWSTGSTGTSIPITASGTYWLQASTNCAVAADSVTIILGGPPVISVSNDTILCQSDSVQLNASGAVSYSWAPPLNLTSLSVSNPTASPVTSTTYTVTGFDASGCSSSGTISVSILTAGFFTPPDTTISCNESVMLTTGVGTSGFSYHWEPSYGLSDTASANPVAYPDVATTYTLIVQTDQGCELRIPVAVNVEAEDIYIPNAFSPNADDINDYFSIINSCGFELTYFRIYNRWGQMVWETNDITEGWPGTFNEVPCGMGVYVWVVVGRNSYNNQSVMKKGNVSLIK